MRCILIVAITAAFILPAAAENEKLCIFAAAQKLPNIPGMTIKESRTGAVPKGADKGGGAITMMVEIDVRAANQDATFSYVCATAPGKPAFVESLGMK